LDSIIKDFAILESLPKCIRLPNFTLLIYIVWLVLLVDKPLYFLFFKIVSDYVNIYNLTILVLNGL